MKKYLPLIITLILLIGSTIYTIYGIINTIKIDNKIESKEVEVKCINAGGEDFKYSCTYEYKFEHDNKEYVCNKHITSDFKVEDKENKTIYYSSKDPSNCRVDNKIYPLVISIIINLVLLFGFIIIILGLKKSE